MADRRLPRALRIRRRFDFLRIYRRRCTAGDESLVVYGGPNGLPYPRLGLSVSRKVGSAVVRNRWRRLLREAFRLSRPQLPPGVDLIVIPRPAGKPELAALMVSLPRLAERIARKLPPRTQSGGLSTQPIQSPIPLPPCFSVGSCRRSECSARSWPGTDRAGGSLQAVAQPAAGAALPLSADLQHVFHPGGPQVRADPGDMAGHVPHCRCHPWNPGG